MRPRIVLTHAPADEMEDHMNTALLAGKAAFVRGLPNFVLDPPIKACGGDATVSHSMPHGLVDGLGRRVEPDLFGGLSGSDDDPLAAALGPGLTWSAQGDDAALSARR